MPRRIYTEPVNSEVITGAWQRHPRRSACWSFPGKNKLLTWFGGSWQASQLAFPYLIKTHKYQHILTAAAMRRLGLWVEGPRKWDEGRPWWVRVPPNNITCHSLLGSAALRFCWDNKLALDQSLESVEECLHRKRWDFLVHTAREKRAFLCT